MLSFPFSLIGQLGLARRRPRLRRAARSSSPPRLAQVAATAFVAPFTAAVTSLQYIDQRMRKEAYDVELMRQAGILDA